MMIGDDGGADRCQDGQEHADLLGRGGDQLADQDLLHLGTGVDGEPFQRRTDSATSSGLAPGRSRTSTALTVLLLVCEALIEVSRPGTPGRLKADWSPCAHGSARWRRCPEELCLLRILSGMKTIGSPLDETMRRVSPTTV